MSRVLLDTHLLLWAAGDAGRLGSETRAVLVDPATEPVYSAASSWEIAIKLGLGRTDFVVDLAALLTGLRHAGWRELPVTSDHARQLESLPPLHRDPFDRMLVAQAIVEGIPLLTRDREVAAYGAPVRLV